MPKIVECYSGYTYAQEPLAFLWEGQRYTVEEVEARWRTPEGPAFRVRADGEHFLLAYVEHQDVWVIEPVEG